MKTKKTQKQGKKYVFFIISCIVGGMVGYFGARYLDVEGFTWGEVAGLFVGLVLSIYIQIIVHEAGHFVFGYLTGYRFVSFRIGNWIVYKKGGKLHFGKYSLAGTGGQCLMTPPEFQDGKIPYVIYNLGGSLMNLLCSGFLFVILKCVKLPNVVSSGIWFTVLFGVFFALMNGIPMKAGEVDNDGANARSLGKDQKALRGLWIQLKVNQEMTEGIRLKDMPEAWFLRPSEEEMKNSMCAAVEAIRCNRLMDQMKLEEANQEITEVLQGDSGMVGVQKIMLQIDRVYCEIFGEQRREILDDFQDKQVRQLMKAMKNYPSVLRTQYVYAKWIEQDEKKAAELFRKFEKAVKYYPIAAEVECEWELIRNCR